ncbi:MAG: hypothetical protein DCF31_10640 [Alphaproteobacteria bacterium]|nr:MAG: hypothetical protein DCF31_10640 [Alphaproteobacteria bacterium]
MTTMLNGQFDTRRQAEMTIERLVQEYGVDRAAITVTAAGDANTAGLERAGSDNPAENPLDDGRGDAALAGAVRVEVALADSDAASDVRRAFAEFSANDVEQE